MPAAYAGGGRPDPVGQPAGSPLERIEQAWRRREVGHGERPDPGQVAREVGVGGAYAAQTLAALRGGELTNIQRTTQLWQVVASTPWSIAPSVDASGRPWLSVVMGIPAMRLLFSYDGEEVTLTSQQRLEMALPASDLQEPQDRAGFWAEVRDADGQVLDRRAMPDPLRADVEVFSPGETPRWVALDRPQGAFTVVVADHPEADHVALVGNDTAAIRARFTSPGPHEIGRFALEPHPGEGT